MHPEIIDILSKLGEDIHQIKLRLERGSMQMEEIPALRIRIKSLEDSAQLAAIREARTAAQLQILWWFASVTGGSALTAIVAGLWMAVKHAP